MNTLIVMPLANGQNSLIMEKQKLMNNVASTNSSGEPSLFICTECGDGFSRYCSLLVHMTIHGPLESFSFDGSSNGFDVPREYVLQENGTLAVVNGLEQVPSSFKPPSPGILPSHLPSPIKLLSPATRPPSSPCKDLVQPRFLETNLRKARQCSYSCEICNKSFSNLQSLQHHQQYRNTERGYKCTLCCKVFDERQDHKKHIQSHINESFHSCGDCGKRFLKVASLTAHQIENHPPLNSDLGKSLKRIEKTYPCKRCKLIFFWMSDLQTHSIYNCKGKKPKLCLTSTLDVEVNTNNPEAPLAVSQTSGKSAHDQNGKSKPLEDKSCRVENELASKSYRCGLCGNNFQNLATLKEHHLTHQTQEEIDQLNQESQRILKHKMTTKRRHRRGNIQNGKLYPCKQCNRVFHHSSSLSRHMRYHKGTMHSCQFCGRLFPQRCDLRRHVVMYHPAALEHKPTSQNEPLARAIKRERMTGHLKSAKSSSNREQIMSSDQSPNENRSGKVGRINYKCQDCGKKFGLLCVYQRHLRYHKKEPKKNLQGVSDTTSASSPKLNLENHQSTGLNQVPEETKEDPVIKKDTTEEKEVGSMDCSKSNKDNAVGLYECIECTKTFSCSETFLQHQATHGSG
ncbi:zinc finger protein 91 [Gouania willdenowi]|uniref:zinc finger protein 91 n=1 Tax=Gouania willdenowi TaxID=441366 RepID=UPI0010569ADD|nr:zinc finger protein 91-like [Gouania willdenowi]XP_028325952.1 zinc finger protein 91-like [Gouania willdenowi]XP_028325953.1 zinc finger protein 91-like [Gouania willdenowi]